MKILSLIRDLIFSSKLRAAASELGHDVISVRTLDQLSEAITSPDIKLVVIDLGCGAFDPFSAIEQIRGSAPHLKLIAFYSHVEVELAERAGKISGLDLFTRSQFSMNVSEIIS